MKLATISAWLWLLFGLVWLLMSTIGVFRWPDQQSIVRAYYDGLAIAASELGPQLLLIAIAVSSVFMGAGAHRVRVGMIAGALTLIAVSLLVVSISRAVGDADRFEAALQKDLGADYRRAILPERVQLLREEVSWRTWMRPIRFDLEGIETLADISYGPHGERNRLDILRPADPAARHDGRLPVLIQMHGGGFISGGKNMAGKPLMHLLARRGWIVVTLNYRLGPEARWPSQLVDAKRAVAWIREHIAEYGGDPDFIVATGASAGGNLSALLALTAGQARYQPGFETADTRIQAAVPVYAGFATNIYREQELLGRLLRDKVLSPEMLAAPSDKLDIYPSMHITADAAPMFVLTGTHDGLALVEETRVFVDKLRAVSKAPLVFAEAHGANHGFDDAHSIRAEHAANAVQRFLEFVYSEHLRKQGGKAP